MKELLTPFEHALIGSTVEARYRARMHTPLFIQDGGDIKQCDELRQLLGSQAVLPSRYDVRGTIGIATLPGLGESGEPMNDPVLYLTDRRDYHGRFAAGLAWRDGPCVAARLLE